MLAEDRFLCVCARQSLQPGDVDAAAALARANALDWELICRQAEWHGIAPLVYSHVAHGLRHLAPPADALERLRRVHRRNILVSRQTMQDVRAVLDFFGSRGIRVMLIKGEAFSQWVYGQPWLTAYSDVDVVVEPERAGFSRAQYAELAEVIRGLNLRTMAHKRQIEFDFALHHDFTINGVLSISAERVWRDARPMDYAGRPAWVLSSEDMLLSACVNAHRKRFFRLKALCDVRETALRFADLDWGLFAERARECGAGGIAYAALSLSRDLLGPAAPGDALAALGVSPTRRAAIRVLSRVLARLSLARLNPVTEYSWTERRFSWPLLLTYATLPPTQVARKLGEVRRVSLRPRNGRG